MKIKNKTFIIIIIIIAAVMFSAIVCNKIYRNKELTKKSSIDKALSSKKMDLPKYVKIVVPYINQKKPVYTPMGCEGASLLMALKYKGVNNITFKEFLDKMPKSPDNNPFNGFAGSPYEVQNDIFQSIFPKALSSYGKQYHKGVENISGATSEELKAELYKGNPVVVYVTNRKFEAPRLKKYTFGKKDYTIISNLHVVLLVGYNENDNTFYIADPNDKGYYWIDKNSFEAAYNIMKWAVVVR